MTFRSLLCHFLRKVVEKWHSWLPGKQRGKHKNLLDPIGKYGEADENTYAAIQVPDR